ncbi:MAG: type II secretion system protein [Bacillota bacterium]
MFRNLTRRSRKQEGFTLIELIVVVAILGILAAVLTPRVLDAIENARANAAEANAKQIQLAMERYLIQNNQYPDESQITSPATLATVLAGYTSLDAAALDDADADDFIYAGYSNSAGTTAVNNTAGNVVKFYEMRVTFVEGNVVYKITPNGLTKNGTVTDSDP